MNGPLSVFLASALAASAAYLVKDARRSALLAVVTALVLAGLVLLLPLDRPLSLGRLTFRVSGTWSFLGVSLSLRPPNRAVVGFLYALAGFLLGGVYVLPGHRGLSAAGLAMTGLIAAALMIEPFVFAPLLIQFAALMAVLVLSSPWRPVWRASGRLIVVTSLSLFSILMAGWLVDARGVTAATPDLAAVTAGLLGLGFAVLMAVPPFHLWLPLAAEEGRPYSMALVAVLFQSAGTFFLLRFLDTFLWLRELPLLPASLSWLGGAMAVFAGALVLAQDRPAKALAYGVLADSAVVLMAVGLGTAVGYRLALGVLAARVIGVAAWALGVGFLEQEAGADGVQAYEGVGFRAPWAAAAAVAGMLTVAGFPLTAGFPARWSLLNATSGVPALLLLAGMALTTAGALRWLGVFFRRSVGEASSGVPGTVRALLGGGVVLTLVIGVFPQVLFPWVVQVITGLSNLAP